MESIEIQGTIALIEETKSYGASNFQKRLCVIDTGGKYPQQIPVEFVQNKCAILDSYGIGQEVIASINLRSNEWNGKYFLSAQAWKINNLPLSGGAPVNNGGSEVDKYQEKELPNEPELPEEDPEDPLPFW